MQLALRFYYKTILYGLNETIHMLEIGNFDENCDAQTIASAYRGF